MSVTGHRIVASLASYIKPSEGERESLSRALCSFTVTNENLHKTPSQCLSGIASATNKYEAVITPPIVTSPSRCPTESNLDISLHESRAMHMFTGAISNSNVTLNVYNAKQEKVDATHQCRRISIVNTNIIVVE